MKKFELIATVGDVELYKAVFAFSEADEKTLLKNVSVLSGQEKQKGGDTAIVDNQMNTASDVVIRAVLQARGKDQIVAFEKHLKKHFGVGTTVSVESFFKKMQWNCRRVGCLEVVK